MALTKRTDPKIFYGWWIVAASLVMFMVIGGTAFYGFTSFFDPIVAEFGWSRAETSLGFSLRSLEAGAILLCSLRKPQIQRMRQ